MSTIASDRRAPSTDAQVVVDGAGKEYRAGGRTVVALAPVSLTIEPGALVSIVGRSGSGKSTLLRLMSGLTAPSTGRISYGGEPVVSVPAGVRSVFQDYQSSLLPWMSVGRNVRFGIRHSSSRRKRSASSYLAAVGLENVDDRYPWELSGGMQQRVAIARALASEPSLLFMDEPFSAVDALSRSRLQDVTQQLWLDLGITIVFVTHDIEEAIYLSDRVIVLSPDGAGVQEDLAIDLPRPRDQLVTRESSEFLAYRRTLTRLVAEES